MTQIPRIHRDHTHHPFDDRTRRYVKTATARHADRDRYEADLADALDRLMRRAHTGHSTRAEQRLLTRGTPTRTPPPARAVREEWEQDLDDTVCGKDEDGLDELDDGCDESPLPDTGEDELDSPAPPYPGYGLYDAHEETLKR
ncbi:hypothetical protein [Embleya sp. NPDC050493]|uniref:hypothetical protein n=1 Tax=Embleya sp. NPDC050493 TaxID=3363989 RepID=UPI0037B1E434